MTFEQLIGSFLAMMVTIISFFVKQLVNEHRQTRETVIVLNSNVTVLSAQLTALYAKHEATDKKLSELLERLVRLEERSHTVAAIQTTKRKSVA